MAEGTRLADADGLSLPAATVPDRAAFFPIYWVVMRTALFGTPRSMRWSGWRSACCRKILCGRCWERQRSFRCTGNCGGEGDSRPLP